MIPAFQNCSKFEDRTNFGKPGNPNINALLHVLHKNIFYNLHLCIGHFDFYTTKLSKRILPFINVKCTIVIWVGGVDF